MHPFEDAEANKRLEFWIEMEKGAPVPSSPDSLRDDFLRALAATNQDFRESIRMVPESRRPQIKVFAFGESPISGQDPRIKKRYIV
jgi:hypothetical protein